MSRLKKKGGRSIMEKIDHFHMICLMITAFALAVKVIAG
nr:MAG TPA: hypothetical protein [Caudoviricetes sp.]